jgi:hypothetical protein
MYNFIVNVAEGQIQKLNEMDRIMLELIKRESWHRFKSLYNKW